VNLNPRLLTCAP